MALDNWFQNWHPPFFHDSFHGPTRNFTNDLEQQMQRKPSNPSHFLPIFLSFNLLKPDEKKAGEKTKYSQITPRRKETFSHDPFGPSNVEEDENEEVFNYKLPEDDPSKYGSKSSFYPYASSLGFPDPFENEAKANRTYEKEHGLKPLEITGPFKTWYRWKTLDFVYPSHLARSRAIANEDYIAENILPLGIEVYKHRIFLSMPKWKKGIPVTLAQVPRVPKEESPLLIPYPNWEWHSEKSCDLMTSVFRMQVDTCGRIWVLDSGKISITTEQAKQHCPPKLLIFDLETDQLVAKYIFRKEFILQDGLYSNIIVDIRDGDCDDAYAYMSDVWRFGLVVFRLLDHKAWLVSDHLFYPDPLAAEYRLHHLKFYWMDGIFGLALSPAGHSYEERLLYFHSMSGYREFYVKTSYLRNEDVKDKGNVFKILGESRGDQGHVSSSVMDKNGIMFYNLVTRDSIACWDSRKPYKKENMGVIAKSKESLVFPNDIRLDQDKKQSMWIITNRLPYYLIEGLDTSIMNFRILSAYTEDSVKGTICDPKVYRKNTFVEPSTGIDCH